jgi:hypothetical protein
MLPFVIQASVFEFPVAQAQVTVSPGHTDCLSQIINGATINMIKIMIITDQTTILVLIIQT